ncbi:MAG: DUF2219 family protein [Bacteroidales bacterium]|nr:DUF2219 family protein [Bacteroidales bacterium]
MKTTFFLTIGLSLIVNVLIGKPDEFTPDSVLSIEESISRHVKGQFGIDVEQDWFVDWMPNKNFDRNYTQGTGFYYTKPELGKSFLFLPMNFFEWLNNLNGKNKYLINYPATIAIGVTAFTPGVIDSPTPVVGDRPFAGLMYLSTIKNKYNYKSKALIQTSFNYGILGSNITNTFQSFAHEHIIPGRPTEISWHHQISEGGSFAFMFSHKASRSILNFPNNDDSGRKWFDASIGYQVDIGWYTGISALSKIKVGFMTPYSLNSTAMDVSLDVGNKLYQKALIKSDSLETKLDSIVLDKRTNDKILKKKSRNDDKIQHFENYREFKTWDAFAFFSMTPRVTPYNSLILGQPHVESIYTLGYEDYNPYIFDFEYGVVLSRLKVKENIPLPVSRFDIILSINHRSPEIRNNEYKRWHHWGRISIRFPLF